MSLIDEIQLPSDWSQNFSDEEVHYEELSPSSQKYSLVKSLITSTLACRITSIKRIENPFLLGCYYLKRKEYETKNMNVNEKILFHCTSRLNVQNIARNNLDWRKTVRGRFGQGVSFSPYANYAHKYANNSIGNHRAMIVMIVLTSNEINGSYSVEIPPPGFDTTTDSRGNVCVKYYDYEFYPVYVVEYIKNLVIRI